MFKKSMAALAVLSLSAGLASASEVTLYGIVDNGLLYKHSKESSSKPLFPSRIEQNCSVRFFFTTSKNGVFFAIKIV